MWEGVCGGRLDKKICGVSGKKSGRRKAAKDVLEWEGREHAKKITG